MNRVVVMLVLLLLVTVVVGCSDEMVQSDPVVSAAEAISAADESQLQCDEPSIVQSAQIGDAMYITISGGCGFKAYRCDGTLSGVSASDIDYLQVIDVPLKVEFTNGHVERWRTCPVSH